jgi:hypothetical protein
METIPFIVGRPVSGEYFINRQEELRRAKDMLVGGQGIALISPRKFGKTSLLDRVLDELKRGRFLVGKVNCQNTADVEELAREITKVTLKGEPSAFDALRSVWEQKISPVLKRIKSLSGSIANIITLHVEFTERRVTDRELLRGSLGFIEEYAREKRKRVVFAFDEFSDLAERDGQVLKLMRASMERHKNVTYVISGSQESTMEFIIGSKQSPFYLFFKEIRLGPLPKRDTREFLRRRFKKFGVKPTSEAIDRIIELAQRIPDYTQRLAGECYDLVRGERLTVEHVNKSYEKVLDELSIAFEEKWGTLSKAALQMKVIKTLAATPSPYELRKRGVDPKLINQAVEELIRKGYVKKMGRAKYEFVDPLFKEFVRRRVIVSGESS